MNVRADLSQPAIVLPADWQWVDSPLPGVSRVMLDRVGDEVAVATSLVRYAPGSSFSGHQHTLGEEFIVLEGEFGDEHGRYPVGTYVRNPPGSQHVPFSEPGCLIWVKLRQFDEPDQRQCVLTMNTPIPGSGQLVTELHSYEQERVIEIVSAAGEVVELPAQENAQEVLLLEGTAELTGRALPEMSWVRAPAGEGVSLRAETGIRAFSKTRPVYRNA